MFEFVHETLNCITLNNHVKVYQQDWTQRRGDCHYIGIQYPIFSGDKCTKHIDNFSPTIVQSFEILALNFMK